MKSILEIGKRGAEHMDVLAPVPVGLKGVEPYVAVLSKFPVERLEVEINDGTRRDIGVHNLRLGTPRIFDLIHRLAPFEPIVYAKQGPRTVMGMLSPNYDVKGENRQSSVKVIPLITPYPLVAISNHNVVPDARMAVMLAGAAHAEGQGSGSHNVPAMEDFEHKLAMYGAVSLDRATILDGAGQHKNHSVRAVGSVATGLTDGTLGNIFQPGGQETGDFTGYGEPIIFRPGSTTPEDAIYLPESFVASELGFGAHYDEAAQITYGAAVQVLHDRLGQSAVSSRILAMAGSQ